MNPSSVVLDFYDDPAGSGLKKVYPKMEDLPEVIKEAHILNPQEREVLRDEAFAVVMQDQGKTFRKFACVDAGNTLLSVIYFTQNYQQMPEEAVKVAAANLVDACEEFGLAIPELLKEAAAKSGSTRKRDPMDEYQKTDDQDWSQRTNVVSVQGGQDSGQVAQTVSQLKTAEAKQGGDVGTTEQVTSTGKNPTVTNKKVLRVTKKNVVNSAQADSAPAGALPVNQRVVDVTGQKPVLRVKKASAQRFALGSDYPIDTFEQVEQAIDYWEQHWTAFQPVERHEYAVKTAARANELGIRIPDDMDRYGSTEYAPDIEAHLASRRVELQKKEAALYTELQEKRASVSPEQFVEILETLDHELGLDKYYGGVIKDPYYSTFGNAKKAKLASWNWQSKLGGTLSADDLTRLAGNRTLLASHFPGELVEGFAKDPVTIFESLPDDSKELLARLASDR